MNPAATPSAAYLEAIFEMQEESIPTRQARLAEWMGVSPASVSEAVKRLRRDGLVELDARQLRFTPLGTDRARSLIRRRRLAEVFLVEVIGLSWHLAREESSRWDRVVSDEVEDLMLGILADPATCPHGNPIPGAPTASAGGGVIGLVTAMPDEEVTLQRLTEDLDMTPEILATLAAGGLRPGASIRILQAADDGAMSVLVGDKATTLPGRIADNLWVSRATD